MKKPGFFTRIHRTIVTPLWRPGSKDLFFFCIGLRSTLSAGIPIIQSFEIMAQSVRHRLLQKACLTISRDLAAGISFEKALYYQKKLFSPFFLKVLLAGMRSGSISQSLDILVEHYSSIMEIKSKIMQVIIYPMFQLVAGTLIMIVRDLIIHFMGHAFNWQEAMPIIIRYAQYPILGISMAFLSSRVAKDPRVRPYTDNVIMNLPVLGNLYKQYTMATFFQLFATSLEAGRDIKSSFVDALEGMNNYYLAKKIRTAETYLLAGEKISEAFYLTRAFDPEALGMIAAGESSGTIPELSRKMAEFYKSQVKIMLPGYIKACVFFYFILVAVAFFGNPDFLGIGIFLGSFMFFLAV